MVSRAYFAVDFLLRSLVVGTLGVFYGFRSHERTPGVSFTDSLREKWCACAEHALLFEVELFRLRVLSHGGCAVGVGLFLVRDGLKGPRL